MPVSENEKKYFFSKNTLFLLLKHPILLLDHPILFKKQGGVTTFVLFLLLGHPILLLQHPEKKNIKKYQKKIYGAITTKQGAITIKQGAPTADSPKLWPLKS